MPTLHPNITYGWTTDTRKRATRLPIHIPVVCDQKTWCTKLYTKGHHAIRISLLVAASCLLSGPRPMPCVARQHLAARQRTTHSPGSRRQSQCAWKILEGASRSCSSSLPLGLGGWSRAAALCCTHGVRPCAVPGLFGSHRGTAIFESWYNKRSVMGCMVDYAN